MILNIAALLLVLGIAFIHSVYGFYSSVINLFCAIVAMCVSFGYFEVVNDLLTAQGLPGAYTEPAAFTFLFVITLLILRLASDSLLRGNVSVPMYLDWGGGAVCGFFVGQICIGVMVLGFLMLPFGGRAMMFSRFSRNLDNDKDPETQRIIFERHDLWLKSDQFTAGLFSMLSKGSLSGSTEFASIYPDFPGWVFWTGNTMQPESTPIVPRDDSGDGFKKGIDVVNWWRQTTPLSEDYTRYRPQPPGPDNSRITYQPFTYKPPPGEELLGVRLRLLPASADRQKGTQYQRFRLSMFRIVGDIKRGGESTPTEYIPQVIGGADPQLEDRLRVAELDENFSISAGNSPTIDLYFEVPEQFQPRFIEYRRHARKTLASATCLDSPPLDRLTAGAAPGGTGRGGRRGSAGPTGFIDTVNRSATGPTRRLPFAVGRNRLPRSCEVRAGEFVSGRFTGSKSDLEPPDNDRNEVEQLANPQEGNILQVQTYTRRALSLPGQVLNFAASVANQYEAISDTGDTYPLAGYYAIVKRNGEDYIEFFFTPDPLGTGFRSMLDFSDDKIRNELRDQEDARLGLIFVLPPGTCVTAIRSQGGTLDFGDTRFCAEK